MVTSAIIVNSVSVSSIQAVQTVQSSSIYHYVFSQTFSHSLAITHQDQTSTDITIERLYQETLMCVCENADKTMSMLLQIWIHSV